MCLRISSTNPQDLFGGKKLITCYKLMDISVDGLITPFYPTVYPKKGVVKSDRPTKELTEDEKESNHVHKGIHVYVHLKDALSHRISGDVVLPVLCHVNDFVAHQQKTYYHPKEAVFTKIRIHKRAAKFKYVVNPYDGR
jgi:hypothetical protein